VPTSVSDWTSFFPYIKDFGLPIVALYYLFKLYQAKTDENVVREDKYVAIIEAHNKNCGDLSAAIANLVIEIRRESDIRQELLSKLVDSVLSHRTPPFRDLC
jgi:hypothetical protein